MESWNGQLKNAVRRATRSMSPDPKSGDKSSFPTTIVMMVMGSINDLKTKAACCKGLPEASLTCG
jgi:hypothetical protein